MALFKEAVEFVPWAIAIALRTVSPVLSITTPVGWRTSPTTYTIPAFETTMVSPGVSRTLLLVGALRSTC